MALIDRMTWSYLQTLGAKSRWVDSDHGPLHALTVRGTGTLPPLVLVHGLSARCTHFALMTPFLRRHFSEIVLPDLLGHGRSTVPAEGLTGKQMQLAFNDHLDALIDEPVVLYGNSLGGCGTIRYAAARPDRVEALIVNSPGGGHLGAMSVQDYMERFRVHSRQDAMHFADTYLGRLNPLRSLVARGVLNQLSSPAVRSFIDCVDESDLITPEQLAALRMPVLMLWGQRDGVMVPEQRQFFQTHLPTHARFEEPPGYGHAPFLEHPVDLSRRIKTFIQEHRSV